MNEAEETHTKRPIQDTVPRRQIAEEHEDGEAPAQQGTGGKIPDALTDASTGKITDQPQDGRRDGQQRRQQASCPVFFFMPSSPSRSSVSLSVGQDGHVCKILPGAAAPRCSRCSRCWAACLSIATGLLLTSSFGGSFLLLFFSFFLPTFLFGRRRLVAVPVHAQGPPSAQRRLRARSQGQGTPSPYSCACSCFSCLVLLGPSCLCPF